jgi:ribosomal protein L6P/L9E
MLKKKKYIYLKIPQYINYSYLTVFETLNLKFFKYIFKGPLGNIFNYFIQNLQLNLYLKKDFIFFFSQYKKINIFIKLYYSLIKNIFKGILIGFYSYIKLKGLSYRI